MVSSKQVIAIVGSTCTGKTDLSIELAKRFQSEIIALDSRTIYRKMDIGTAKPTAEQQKIVKHHALDILEPSRFFTVSEYVQTVKPIMENILAQNKLPIVCGGTGLYGRALLEGIQIPPVPPQPNLREELNRFADEHGNEALQHRLNKLDAITASRLSVNDRRRIIRALEVCMITGQPFSTLSRKDAPPFNTLWIGLRWLDRAQHKKLIIQRLNYHLECGLLNEVKELMNNLEYRPVLNNAVNYKEFIPFITKTTDWDNAYQQCIQDNYQLARKQNIWFNANSAINWFDLDSSSLSDVAEKVFELYEKSISNPQKT